MKKAIKISSFLKLTTIVTTAAVVISIICSVFVLQRTAVIIKLDDDRAKAQQAGSNMKIATDFLSKQVRLYVMTSGRIYYNNYNDEIETVKTREKAMEQLLSLNLPEEELNYINECKDLMDKITAIELKALTAVSEKRTQDATNLILGLDYNSLSEVMEQDITRFNNHLTERLQKEFQDEQRNLFIMLFINGILLIVVLLITIFIYNINKKRVIKPLNLIEKCFAEMADGNLQNTIALESDASEIGQLTASLKKMQLMLTTYIKDISTILGSMAEGNMTSRIDRDYIGDFKGIKASINNISDSLRETLSQINQAADQVSSGSEQVSSGAQALSQGASNQADSLEELSRSITKLSEQILYNAQSAAESSELSNNAADQLIVANKQMEQLMAAMADISKKSDKIGSINKVIEDIAFQTNILALNAAVEAARAGAAGKGFAVVADEVRNLASKSAQASKNTTELVENSIKSINEGTKLAAVAANTLEKVLMSTKQSNELSSKISVSTNEQTVAVAGVTSEIEQISAVVQTNSATAEESAAASEELSGQAQMLKNLVEKFQLEGDSFSEENFLNDIQEDESYEASDDYVQEPEEVEQTTQSKY